MPIGTLFTLSDTPLTRAAGNCAAVQINDDFGGEDVDLGACFDDRWIDRVGKGGLKGLPLSSFRNDVVEYEVSQDRMLQEA